MKQFRMAMRNLRMAMRNLRMLCEIFACYAKFKRGAATGQIQSTSWSPLYTYYISFRSSGSQESNTSNGVQIEAKMKKLWPFEDNCTKLDGHFAPCAKFRKHYEMTTK